MANYNFKNDPIAVSTPAAAATVDLSLSTQEKNYGCIGEARALNVIYEDVQANEVVWQPDVYFQARALADELGVKRVVDVGCGSGDKLVKFFPGDLFDVVGIDFKASLKLARERYPAVTWLECDLTSFDQLRSLPAGLASEAGTIFVLSDVIEHLVDPAPFLMWVRENLMASPANRLVISTPDRHRLGNRNPDGVPGNEAHVREWTLDELCSFLASSGFAIEQRGFTRANQYDTKNASTYVVVSCHKAAYLGFLRAQGVIFGDVLPTQVLITTEYAGLHSTGGIGTFVKEQREVYGYDDAMCLIIGAQESSDDDGLRRNMLVSPRTFFDPADIATLPLDDQALRALQQILYYIPGIRAVHYADYQGTGCRIAQASRTELLPSSVCVVAHCHGMTHYLENAHESWFGTTHMGVAEKEKISTENADLVVFPTTFLKALYSEAGINIAEQKSILLRYPYAGKAPDLKEFSKIDSLMFYGKRSTMKGFDLFLGTIMSLGVETLKAVGIKTITIVGPVPGASLKSVELLKVLKENFKVEELSGLDRMAAMSAVAKRAHHSLCLMPYLADNHPYALLDVVYAGALPLMVRAGGVPELFPEDFQEILLADPTVPSLVEHVAQLVNMPVEAVNDLRRSFVSAIHNGQLGINERAAAFQPKGEGQVRNRATGEVTIIVPVFNTPLNYISDLLIGINCQTYPPSEVIFVDDASEVEYVTALAALVAKELVPPHRIVSHAKNKGLAGARNTGVAETKTEFVMNIDSDDVPLNCFVSDLMQVFAGNPDVVAAIPYLTAFDDGTPCNRLRFGMYVYRPLGDGVVSSQLDNFLGHANSAFRTAVLREFGGWDESSKSMWEDWALFLKLTSAGRKLMVMPKVACLYRVRQHSMLRTYKVWPATRRLANNMLGLPRFENFRLQAMMRAYRECEKGLAESEQGISALKEQLRDRQQRMDGMERELNRISVRIPRGIANWLSGFPGLFSISRAIGKGAMKMARVFRAPSR